MQDASSSPTPRRRSNSADNLLGDGDAASASGRKSIRYRGANIPSRTFQRLCGAAPGQPTVPPLRTPRSRARLAAAAAAGMAELGIAAVEMDSGATAIGTTASAKVEQHHRHQSDEELDCDRDKDELLNNEFFLKLRRKLDRQTRINETSELSDLQCEAVTKETVASSATRIQELRAALQQSRLEAKCR